jgi:hypothetical protein
MERVSISNFSGAAFYCPKKRHGPKVRFSYFQGCGKSLQVNGIATLNGTGQYEPNVYDNSDSDAEYLHNGCGGAAGDSYFIQNGETCQFNGGDCWASANPELGYFAIRATGMDYLIIRGMDLNGKVYIKGNGAAALPVTSQVRIIGNNFRFRKSSFGNDDLGQPAPLDAYVELEDAPGVTFVANTYTPYYAPATGIVTARPSFVYKTTGQSIVVTYDRFPSLTDNAWPAGATIGPTPALTTISNGLGTKVIMCSGYMDTVVGFANLMQAIQFAPGGGILRSLAGTALGTNYVGSYVQPFNGSGALVPITSATNTDVETVTLPPGSYRIDCAGLFLVASGSPSVALVRMGISTVSGSIPTTNPMTYAERQVGLVAAGTFAELRVGPVFVDITVNTTYYLTLRCNYSPGTVSAMAHISVTPRC